MAAIGAHQKRGVAAAAVFSGDGGDPRMASLAAFHAGSLEALCERLGGPALGEPRERLTELFETCFCGFRLDAGFGRELHHAIE